MEAESRTRHSESEGWSEGDVWSASERGPAGEIAEGDIRSARPAGVGKKTRRARRGVCKLLAP